MNDRLKHLNMLFNDSLVHRYNIKCYMAAEILVDALHECVVQILFSWIKGTISFSMYISYTCDVIALLQL